MKEGICGGVVLIIMFGSGILLPIIIHWTLRLIGFLIERSRMKWYTLVTSACGINRLNNISEHTDYMPCRFYYTTYPEQGQKRSSDRAYCYVFDTNYEKVYFAELADEVAMSCYRMRNIIDNKKNNIIQMYEIPIEEYKLMTDEKYIKKLIRLYNIKEL